jgi:hypothetical protein
MYSNDTIEAGAGGAVPRAALALRASLGPRGEPLMRLLAWAERLPASAVTWGCVVLGLGLLSPSLGSGLVADDYLHALMLRDHAGLNGLHQGASDLFRFADGQPDTARALVDEGVFPWWVDPRALLAFFRPLASLSHALDHQLWPTHPGLMHLHSLVWYGVLIAVVALTYRELGLSRRGQSLALLLFAIDDAHAPSVGWIANRNAIIALCWALPALVMHHRQRRHGFVHGFWLGPLLLSIGLCGGEGALCVLAYLLAYAVCLDVGPWHLRLGSLVPYAVVVVSWKLCCLALGHGVSGSGVYVDPLADPVGFARAACERFPVLGLGLFLGPFADFWELYPLLAPGLRVLVLVLALGVLATLAFALRPLMRRDARVEFWVTGTLLCLLLMCATFPHDRLLLGPGVGGMVLVAVLLEAAWLRRSRRAPALGLGVLAGVHLIIAPVLAPLRAAEVGHFSELLRRTDDTLPTGGQLKEQTVVLLNPPLDPFAAYLPIYREAEHQPRPRQQLWLASGTDDIYVQSLDAHTLLVRPDGGFLSSSMQRMLRGATPRFHAGQRVTLDGASVLVTEVTGDGRPAQIAVRFERTLADPSLIWMRWRHDGYEPFRLPPIGQGVLLPGANIYELLFTS